jgi:hypothetical protein
MAAGHLGGTKPTPHAAVEEMPNEKPPRRKPGPKPSRTSYTAIDFHLSPGLHQAMKAFASERRVFLEDVYREAAEHFLEQRTTEKLAYWAAPKAKHGTHVYVRMTDVLRASMRAAAAEDHQGVAHAFETAVRLYLKHHERACS